MKIIIKNENELRLGAKSKILVLGLILITSVGLLSPGVKLHAQTKTDYQLLAPLPDPNNNNQLLKNFDLAGGLGSYLNLMIKLIIGISAVLAVVMIVIGGMEYMMSELLSSKEEGRKRMTNAVFGLLIALGAWALLNTINPDLLKGDIKIPGATVTITATTNSAVVKPASASSNCVVAPAGNSCAPGNLSAFGGQANNASRICMVESGGSVGQISRTDRCSSGTGFSYGLFQINLIANGASVRTSSGVSCTNLFEREDGSLIQGSNYINPSGSPRIYNCRPKQDQASADRLSACAVALLNPAENIRVAVSLNQARPGFQDWRYSDQGVCPVAFQ